MKEKMVCIEWEDASYNSGYYDKKSPEDFEAVKTKTVGMLVRKTPKVCLVAGDRFYNSKGKPTEDRHISTIPKKMIRKIIYLEAKDAAQEG